MWDPSRCRPGGAPYTVRGTTWPRWPYRSIGPSCAREEREVSWWCGVSATQVVPDTCPARLDTPRKTRHHVGNTSCRRKCVYEKPLRRVSQTCRGLARPFPPSCAPDDDPCEAGTRGRPPTRTAYNERRACDADRRCPDPSLGQWPAAH